MFDLLSISNAQVYSDSNLQYALKTFFTRSIVFSNTMLVIQQYGFKNESIPANMNHTGYVILKYDLLQPLKIYANHSVDLSIYSKPLGLK